MSTVVYAPITLISEETFVDFKHVGGEPQETEFTRQVHWAQMSTAEVHFLHGGKVLRKGYSTCDSGSYLGSLNLSVIDPASIANDYDVTVDSSLEVIQVITIQQEPYFQSPTEKAESETNEHGLKFMSAILGWRQRNPNADGPFQYQTIQPKLLCQETVWSSKNTPEENARLRLSVAERFPAACLLSK